MKNKLLPRTRLKTICAVTGVALQFCMSSASWAYSKPYSPGIPVHVAEIRDNSGDLMQKKKIRGTITDQNGATIIGASIKEKGTANGTISDANGNYSMEVADENSVVIASYLGYVAQEVPVGTSSVLNITLLADSENLDEVVVVGYGTQRRSELTNAVVQTTGKELKKSTAVSVSNSLSGRMSGVFVNQRSSVPGFDDAEILIRGPKTYRNSSALIVIDGVASNDPDGLNRLDPNDIETISVLKDASAAIYGAQSAGGVILVTTKRGITGKPSLDFSDTHSFQTPTMKTKSANALEYMKVLNDRRALEGTSADFPADLVESYRSGERRSEDWYDALIDGPAKQSRQSLTVRGGTDIIKYFASIGMASQGGILRADDITKLKQYNVRSNLDVNITSNLQIGLDLLLREKDTRTPQSGGGGGIGYFAITSPLKEAYIDGDYRYPGEGWSQSNPAARILGPGYRKYKADVATGTFKFNYDLPFAKGVSLGGYLSLDKTLHYNKTFNYTWFYYEKNTAGEVVKKTSRIIEDIGLREDFSQSVRTTGNIKLSYDKTLNEDHKIDAFIAYEQMEYGGNNFWAQRLGYDSPLIDQLFAGSTDRSNWSNDGGASESARQNYFGRVNYGYQGKYLLGFSARYDGSPIFPKETRFGFFPQASGAWVVSKEDFMANSMFSNLKIRGSWGQLGNDRVDPFQYVGAFGYSTGWVVDGVDSRGISATSTPNPNITWEVSETTDIGLELGFLKNRLNVEIDVYSTKTKNILGKRQASIPGYTGLSLPDENIGRMDSRGIDFQAGYFHTFGEMNLRLSGNISYNENEIVYFDEVPQAEPYQKLEGMPLNSTLVYKAIGIYRTQQDLDDHVNYPNAELGGLIYADLNKDGLINTNDRYMYDASSFPKVQFGLNVGMEYKNLDLTFLVQGQSGANWRLSNGFNSGANGNGLVYVAENSYSLENTNALLPRIGPIGIEGANSDFFYNKATWLRFKSIDLGYTIPKSTLSKIGVSALRIYVSGDNVFMLYNNLKKFGAGDPEFLSGNGSAYPNMKTMSLGLNLTF